jgi:hypothetical protein
MSNGPNLPSPNLQTSNLISQTPHYTPKPPICQTFIAYKPLKNPIQNAPKCPINLGKTRKKYIKGLIISRKPGKKVCLFVMYYTRGIWYDS